MSYTDQFNEIKEILKSEGRWTPKAFEKFGVKANGTKLEIPLWETGSEVFDFSILDANKRKKAASGNRPSGQKVSLFGNLEFLDSPILLCEGPWDLFSAYEEGFENVVTATNGAKSFNTSMAKKLKGKEIIIIFDNDRAGSEGAIKTAKLLKEQNCKIKIIDLSEYVEEAGDLRDFFNSGKTKNNLEHLLEKSEYFRTELESKVAENAAKVRRLDSIEEKQIDWMFKPDIPFGATTLLTGDPGAGKSTIVSYIASVVSKGGPLFEHPPGIPVEAQKVVIFSVEDPPEQVLRPRLQKFEANLSNIYLYPEILTLDQTGQETIKEIVKIHKPKLVIVDPIVAYIGGKTDTSKANEVREKMSFFCKLAEESQAVILIVRHTTKSSCDGRKLLYAGHGSIDFTASVRSELMLVKHPIEEDKRLLGQIKNNFSKLGSVTLVTMTDAKPILMKDSKEETLEQYLEKLNNELRKSNNVSEEVMAMILEMLSRGPMLSGEFKKELVENGISKRTVFRVIKEKLSNLVVSKRVNFADKGAGQGKWITGLTLHIKDLVKKKFGSEEELIAFLKSHNFKNSTIQECQENQAFDLE